MDPGPRHPAPGHHPTPGRHLAPGRSASPGQQDARTPRTEQGQRIHVGLTPSRPEVQAGAPCAVRGGRIRSDGAEHLSGLDRRPLLEGAQHRLIGGQEPVRVPHRHHAPARHHPAEVHRARLHRTHRGAVGRDLDVDPPMAGTVAVLRRAERLEHPVRRRQRPLPARTIGMRRWRQGADGDDGCHKDRQEREHPAQRAAARWVSAAGVGRSRGSASAQVCHARILRDRRPQRSGGRREVDGGGVGRNRRRSAPRPCSASSAPAPGHPRPCGGRYPAG